MALSKICIFGGSFDPIHLRHIQIAQDALQQFGLTKVIFVPTINPPHKGDLQASFAQRVQMIELAIAGFRAFEVSTMESLRSGYAYTVDTVNIIAQKYPHAEIYCIIGEDSLNYLDQWHKASELFKKVKFIVCKRYEHAEDRRKEILAQGASLLFLNTKPLDISSSAIRKQLGQNVFTPSLPLAVYEYIVTMSLYQSSVLPSFFSTYFPRLSFLLNAKRLSHSLCVANTARALAQAHGIDPIAATQAGLLHDCAKALPVALLQSIAKQANLYLDSETFQTPLLHAPVGAELTKILFGIKNENVYSAIAYHTTGMPGMNALDMVVFLADKIEPSRTPYPVLEQLRKLAKKDLKKAMLLSIESTNAYLKLTNKSMHINTARLLESLN